jgi:hypothetical protein
MSGANPGMSGFGEPTIGHTIDYGVNTLLVAFPRTGEVASVQAQGVARSARLRR